VFGEPRRFTSTLSAGVRINMDLKNPKWMYAKACMFVLLGSVSFALVLVAQPSLGTAVLLLLMIWAFCRAYYFAFYVIERYVDSGYRFSGLLDFLKYLVRKKKSPTSRARTTWRFWRGDESGQQSGQADFEPTAGPRPRIPSVPNT
jgi:hypothetical protein